MALNQELKAFESPVFVVECLVWFDNALCVQLHIKEYL